MRTMLFGGDRRTLFLAELFAKDGRTDLWGLDALGKKSDEPDLVSKADIVVLPYPCFDGEKLRAPFSDSVLTKPELLELCRGKTVFAGEPSGDFIKSATENETKIYNYATEELLRYNAYLTAEGALGIAVNHIAVSVSGSELMVMGCGRIGRDLALLFDKLGANVTVTAMREESRLWAEEMGFEFVPTDFVSASELWKFDGIFNTIPRPVFGKREIAQTGENCLLAELAGGGGGIDREAASKLGRNYVHGGGLPGKTSPKSASEIIYREIKRILETEEI